MQKKAHSNPKKDGKTGISDELKRIEELESELSKVFAENDELKKSLETAKEQEIRSLAEMQNMRRRMEQQRGNMHFESAKRILEAILPNLDNFDLAMQNLPPELKNNEWALGVMNIEKQMYELLKKEGLTEITETGADLDTNKHEAVMVDPKGKKGKVTKILQKGFLYQGKILRPAKVAVGEK
jgi:molecular chaperone GrpE